MIQDTLAAAGQVVRDTVQVAKSNPGWFAGLLGAVITAVITGVAGYFGGRHGGAKGATDAVTSPPASKRPPNF